MLVPVAEHRQRSLEWPLVVLGWPSVGGAAVGGGEWSGGLFAGRGYVNDWSGVAYGGSVS